MEGPVQTETMMSFVAKAHFGCFDDGVFNTFSCVCVCVCGGGASYFPKLNIHDMYSKYR